MKLIIIIQILIIIMLIIIMMNLKVVLIKFISKFLRIQYDPA